jgi:outer membrane immunogenic protein
LGGCFICAEIVRAQRKEDCQMRKFPFAAAAIVLASVGGSALAADLPSMKAPPPVYAPPPPMWTGFYVGLNAGGGWGTTTNTGTVSAPLFDAVALAANAVDPLRANGALINGGTALANTGVANVNQGGFIGGGQIGYNYQWGPSFLIGLEADIQGATIRGSGRYAVASQDSMQWVDPVLGLPCFNGALNTCTLTRTATGSGQVTGGIDWLGTLRGRVGYLITPTLLAYATGGLAYGGVHGSATHSAIIQGVVTGLQGPLAGFNGTLGLPTVPGAGQFSNTQVGWTVGGGVEWMFMPSWSLKAEALYYDLGSVAFASSPVVAVSPITVPAIVLGTAVNAGQPLIASNPVTRVKYDGVIARAGVNYHFNWGAAAPALARY